MIHDPNAVFGTRLAATAVPGYDAVTQGLGRLSAAMGWGDHQSPFHSVVPSGARVLVKPNLVLHENEDPAFGMEELVTHASLIQAVVEAVLLTGATEVVVGDAPIQSCKLDQLLAGMGLDRWAADLQKKDRRFGGIRDFRRTTCTLVGGVRVASEQLKPLDRFVLFDLGQESLLEAVTDQRAPFRVTWYDPRLMASTHGRGLHQYLVAKEVINADVVINLPKLKTHKKAGVTCALKNLIGINGNKEYLPHHRIGGSSEGGDCYPGRSGVKRALESVADRQNQTSSYAAAFIYRCMTFGLTRISRLQGDRLGVEGSWSGNDTIWRTCLDLNRILLYGRLDASLSDTVQRRVLHLVDAVTAGQGNGPLSPQPLALGLLLAADNAAVMDWGAAGLLGYDPALIPISREAFTSFRWPIAPPSPDKIRVTGDLQGDVEDLWDRYGVETQHPIGWVNARRGVQAVLP